jgi:hypothetical protein
MEEKGAPSFPLFGCHFLKFGEVLDYRIVGRGMPVISKSLR